MFVKQAYTICWRVHFYLKKHDFYQKFTYIYFTPNNRKQIIWKKWSKWESFINLEGESNFKMLDWNSHTVKVYLNSELNFFMRMGSCWLVHHTGGPPLTQKSLTQFPLPWFFGYVRAMGDFCVSRGTITVPLTWISCNMVFCKSQNAHKAGTLCINKCIS